MPKAIPIISAFHNLSAGDLADQLGALKAEIAELEAREKFLRDELIRRSDGEVEGSFYRATISDAVRWTLDAKAVRSEMRRNLEGGPKAVRGGDLGLLRRGRYWRSLDIRFF